MPKGCKFAVNRLKEGPEVWTDVIAEGKKYTDSSFKKKDMLFAFPYNSWTTTFWYNYDLFTSETQWVRLGEEYPTFSLYGTGTDWLDTVQGSLGNCYVLAALGALAEFPSLFDNIFLTNEINSSGIYAVKLYIRGKPWIITIDDTVLHYQEGSYL